MALLHSHRPIFDAFRRLCLQHPLLATLATIGGLVTAHSLHQLASFLHLHFLRPSSLTKYKDDTGPSWALVTGASDGIGRAFAEELLDHGFNVILHGRNPHKLKSLRARMLTQWPNRDIELLVLDVMKDVDDQATMEAAAARLKGFNVKVLINNVAGELHPLFLPHAESTPARDRSLINGNFVFATEMTRLLLPQLIENKPSLIMNIGSGASRLPCAYIATAAASKAFLESFSRSLAVEMRAEGHSEVEVLYNLVGLCSTGSEPRPVTFLVPSSRTFAKASLRLVGSGYRVVWGYWPHALQFEPLFNIPSAIVERLCIGLVKQLRHDHQAIPRS